LELRRRVTYGFGFGLSYTTFEYSGLTVTEKEASFTLKNTGGMDGAEVAQLYVSKPDGEVFRPAKELKGFAKVFLKAGESKKVTIPLDDKAFRYFNVDTNKFEVEGGAWTVMIGASCADIKLSGTVEVQGTGAKPPYDKEKFAKYFSGDIKNISDAGFEALLGRPIPDGHWSGTLERNDALCQMYYAKGALGRFAYKILTHFINKSIEKGQPNLNLLFNYMIGRHILNAAKSASIGTVIQSTRAKCSCPYSTIWTKSVSGSNRATTRTCR